MVLERSIDAYPEGIILPIDKPYRWTSADVIRKVKYAAIKHFGKKNLKVGHAGTLDPLATGVLLVCIGAATRQAETLQKHDKEYLAGIAFGATTPSYDREKEIDRFFPYEHITAQAVEAVLPRFLGEQEQIAPLFSAKSVDGQRAYAPSFRASGLPSTPLRWKPFSRPALHPRQGASSQKRVLAARSRPAPLRKCSPDPVPEELSRPCLPGQATGSG